MSTQQVITVLCPECGTESEIVVQDIINGQVLAEKAALLEERLNEAHCVRCHTNITPTIPLLYYDLSKEITFALTPPEASLAEATPAETVQLLTNVLINDLPAGQRKPYLFTPRRFDSRESMVEAILESEGITAETRQRRAAKAQLIETFLAAPDETAFREKIKVYDAKLDYEFFELLTGHIHAAQLAGDESKAQALFVLREHLAALSTQGQQAMAQVDAQLGAAVAKRQEGLLEQLIEARNNQQRENLIADNYTLLDFAFFQQVAAKIDRAAQTGDAVTANSLKALRSNILFLKTEYEKKAKTALEKGEELFKQIIQSDQPDRVIKKNLEHLDESFFFVLGANIERARQQGQEEPAQALEKIGQVAVALLQQHGPSKS
ncbi:MAG: CpXC domain-containing protein [Anaerolineae bacterium]